MNSPGDALVNRMRTELELKGEMIKALRAEREQAIATVLEQADLMAVVCADLHARAAALGLVLEERDPSAAQRAAEHLMVLSTDLADLTAARTGKLVLARETVHLRQLLQRIGIRSTLDLRIAADVPQRVIADQTQLSKLLSQFIHESLESSGAESAVLEVTLAQAGAAQAPACVNFALCPRGNRSEQARAHRPLDSAPPRRLRAALARALCEPLRAARGLLTLTLPLEPASDQAHTGIFRLALSEGSATTAASDLAGPRAPSGAAESSPSDDVSIDMMYLDRQLGSLAAVILARTAPAFRSHAQRRMTDLHVACEIEDLKRLRRLAHAWKGSALSVGACGLAALLEAIEKQAAAEQSPRPSSILQIREELDRVVAALTQYVDRPGSRHERA